MNMTAQPMQWSLLTCLALAIGGCSGVDAAAGKSPQENEPIAQTSQADSTCTNYMSSVRNGIPHFGAFYGSVDYVISLHREDPNWGVQYISGILYPSGTTLSGYGYEYFSIRGNPKITTTYQPFSADSRGPAASQNDAEYLDVSIDANGVMTIYNQTWGFSMGQINFNCSGGMMTVHTPGWGIFTISFTSYRQPAHL